VSAIKVNRQPRAGDVPAPLVAGVVALLVAMFLPMAQRTPVFPTELPPLRDAPGAVRNEHRAALALPAPPATPQVLAAWRAAERVSLRDILANIQAGRGTVGALLTDPSLYEDMKTLVGNVQRNEILRALVRYSIRADEGSRQPTPQATPAAPPSR
jgi:hypothetical protein